MGRNDQSSGAARDLQPVFDLADTVNARDQCARPAPLFRIANIAQQRQHARLDLLHINATSAQHAIAPDGIERAILERTASPALPHILHETSALAGNQETADDRA